MPDPTTPAPGEPEPRDQHCDDPGCACGHRVERYGTTTGGATTEPKEPK